MTRYADPERCPDCGAVIAFGARRCDTCGLSLEGPLAAKLFETLSTADSLLAAMRTAHAAPAAPVPPLAAPAPGPATPTPPPRRAGLSAASVPKILLGLGALCLLVAALVFLAVTWSAMGVAGRTATLIGFTAVAGALAAWAARRDLRAAAESLTVVALGLLAFDLFGARDAGWLGDLSTPAFLAVLGAVLLAAGAGSAVAVRRTPVRVLGAAEVVGVLGLACLTGGGVAADWVGTAAGLTVAVVLAALVASTARTAQLLVLAVGAVVVGLTTWLLLGLYAFDRAAAHASLSELWLEGTGWPLLATAALAGAPALARSLPLVVRLVAVGAVSLVLAGTVLVPLTDEPATQLVLGAAVVVAAVAALAWVVPQPWVRGALAPAAPGLVAMAVVAAGLAVTLLTVVLDEGAAWWTGGAGDTFAAWDAELAPWLLPVTAAAAVATLVAAARVLPAAREPLRLLLQRDLLASAGAATVTLTLAGYPVPVWTVLALLTLTGVTFVLRAMTAPSAPALVAGAVFLAVAVLVSLHATWLTLPALGALLGTSLAVHLRTPRLEVSVGAGVLVAASVAGLAWTVGTLAGAPPEWTATAGILVLVVLVLAGPLVDERVRLSGPSTYARLGTEIGSLAAAGGLGLGGLDTVPAGREGVWLAVYLTLVGAAASAMALLRPDRRGVGWLGGFLLAAASWVRLADLGVDTPEAYTLPAAVALLAVGLFHLRRDPGSSTLAALSPGLALGLVPSLLWVLADPVALRSVLLGLGCLGLVLAGVRLRWSAPVLWGAAVGALVVLRHTAPLTEAVPRWILIGTAGALLIAMGVTWERRVRDARAMAGYVRTLR